MIQTEIMQVKAIYSYKTANYFYFVKLNRTLCAKTRPNVNDDESRRICSIPPMQRPAQARPQNIFISSAYNSLHQLAKSML